MTSLLLRAASISLLALTTASLGACGATDRLANVGKAPNLSAIEDPTAQPGYKPVQMPMPDTAAGGLAPNSLWRQGSRAFFKDQRARQVGDIVTVRVRVTDRANIDNATKRSRKNGENLGAENARLQDRSRHRSCPTTPRPTRCSTSIRTRRAATARAR